MSRQPQAICLSIFGMGSYLNSYFALTRRHEKIEVWFRWKGLAEIIMTIPKFRRVWDKTKDIHANEFGKRFY